MVYLTKIAAVLAVTAPSLALPLRRRAVDASDAAILNFALTLEHLEVAFYTQGLARFDERAFEAAGLPSWARGRFSQILDNELTHVRTLNGVLGPNATQPCNYSFPISDPNDFAMLSATFEGVGASAYTGAANMLRNPEYVTDAAAILATEARQAGWVMSSILKQNPWSTAFETPLDANQAFSLASGFITSCPSTNPTLPVKAFPALNVTNKAYIAGGNITVSFDPSASGSTNATNATSGNNNTPYFLAMLTGLETRFAALSLVDNGTWTAKLPNDLLGTVYALVSNSSTNATDSDTVAGMAILRFPFDDQKNTTANATTQ